MKRKLRMGMVGGGEESFIGPVHRIGALMDNKIELVCGAFSSVPEKSKFEGQKLMLPPNRVYSTYQEMLNKESTLPQNERIDFVSITTPNNTHYEIAMAALDRGFHVLCEKPLTTSLTKAKRLENKVEKSSKLFGLMHNYTGYPMVKEAKHIVGNNGLGTLRRVVVEYPQGWLSSDVENRGNIQASWRVNPGIAGLSSCMGDIGTHCANLAEYITGLRITEVCSDLTTFVSGRKLDDDGSVLIRFGESTRGVLWASQVAVGQENGLNIRVYGENGSIQWQQEEPNTLILRRQDKPAELRRAGSDFISEIAKSNSRIPAGHPEGYLETFANIYMEFANHLSNLVQGVTTNSTFDYPTIHDGVHGMAFIEAVINSTQNNNTWQTVSH